MAPVRLELVKDGKEPGPACAGDGGPGAQDERATSDKRRARSPTALSMPPSLHRLLASVLPPTYASWLGLTRRAPSGQRPPSG